MNCNIQKTFKILAENPYILLLLVTYFLINVALAPTVYYAVNEKIIYVVTILFFLFGNAFFAGWFGMIKSVVKYKETGNVQEDLRQKFLFFKEDFFSSIPTYILPIIAYSLLSIAFSYLIIILANYFMGNPEEILRQITPFANADTIINFILALPKETMHAIVKKGAFIYTGFFIYLLLTFLSIPALFFGKTPNPLCGLKNGFVAIFKKPLVCVPLFVSLVIIHIAIIFIETITVYSNQILMFLALVLRLYFIVFAVVLIFSVYESNFTDNCNNGGDSLGQDEACN